MLVSITAKPRGNAAGQGVTARLCDADSSLARRLPHDTPGGPVPGMSTTFAKQNYSSRPTSFRGSPWRHLEGFKVGDALSGEYGNLAVEIVPE